MSEMALPAPTAFTTPSLSPSWRRVLLASLYLCGVFLVIEHGLDAVKMRIANQNEEVVLDKNTDAAEQGSALRKVVLLGFAAMGVVLLVIGRHSKPWNPHRLGVALVAALLLWAIASVSWAAEPGQALRRVIAWVCFLVGCIGVARVLSPSDLVRVSLVTLCVMVGAGLALDITSGEGPWQSGYRFHGALHPNVQATYCAALCLAAFTLSGQSGNLFIGRAFCAAGLVMIFLTGSRTSLMATALSLGAVWLLRQGRAMSVWVLSTLVASLGLILILFFLLAPSMQQRLTGAALLGRTDKAGTLSGRVPLWQELTSEYAAERPFLGYGYESFWTPGVMEDILKSQDWTMISAHNIYLETVLQMGLVGLALALAAALVSLRLVLLRYRDTGDIAYGFVFGLLIYAFLNGMLEAHFLRPKYPTALALMGVAALLFFQPLRKNPPPQAAEGATT